MMFQRISFDFTNAFAGNENRAALEISIGNMASQAGMDWKISYADDVRRVGILVGGSLRTSIPPLYFLLLLLLLLLLTPPHHHHPHHHPPPPPPPSPPPPLYPPPLYHLPPLYPPPPPPRVSMRIHPEAAR